MSSFSWVSTSPEAAGVGADLVGQHDGAVGQAAEFQLEVDEADVEAQQILGKDVVHLEGIFRDGVDLLLRGQAQGQRVVMVDERVVILVVL